MKICTDSLLFGAMMPVMPTATVLDIGAGTGLLSLIAAQLGAGRATGVELMDGACQEAAENFVRSPWADRLQAVRQSIQDFANTQPSRYDLIISNPPFFENHLNAKEPMRDAARHDGRLKHTELIKIADQLLVREGGLFYVLLPRQSAFAFTRFCMHYGLNLRRQTAFRSYAHSTVRVVALTFGRERINQPSFETLTIYEGQGIYSAASRAYLKNFLLRFAMRESTNGGC